MLEKREEEKRNCKEKYKTTTINTGTLSVEQRGAWGGDPELCLRGRWVGGSADVGWGKKDSYDKLR